MQTLSKEIEKRIEDIVSVRFYNQITPYDVIRWLFNFDDEDVELAVQLLEHVIFLRDDDVKGRLYEQISKLPKDRPKHIVPLGKPGKSGAAISYWIHGLMKRNDLQSMNFHSSVEAFISYRNSVAWETLNDVVVYVDDFIGSGGSVVTALLSLDKKDMRPEVLSDAYSGRLYVVAAIVMDNGYSKITKDISGAVTLWDDCEGITDKDIVSTLFVGNKIKMTFENVKHYCSCIGSWNIDDTLVAFMNRNEEKSMEEFTKLVECNDEHEIELLTSVVQSDDINDNIAFFVFNNRFLIDIWCKDLSQLNETRVRYVVDEGIISISPSTYQDIITEHPLLSKYLLCKNPDNIISEWDEFAFSITTVVEMLSWIEYKKYHNFILNKIELESITPAIANALLSYFSKSDSEFNLSLYTEAMEKSDNPALKVLASTYCIAKRLIAMNEQVGIFAKTKGIFEGLDKQGEVYSISKQIEGAQHFMEALHQSKYIGQVKEKGDYLTGKVLKRKPK